MEALVTEICDSSSIAEFELKVSKGHIQLNSSYVIALLISRSGLS